MCSAHTVVKPQSRTVRACAVRYRPRPLTDRMTAAARWHFILRQWVTIKPIHVTAVAAAAGAAAAAVWKVWRVSLQAGRVRNLRIAQTDRYRPKVRVCRHWPHRARFHILLVTRSAASWSERCYSTSITVFYRTRVYPMHQPKLEFAHL